LAYFGEMHSLSTRLWIGALLFLLPGISIYLSGQSKPAPHYRIVEADNPVFRGNELFPSQEDLRSDRFPELIQRYQLDAVVAGENNEFKRILLLRNWIKRHIRIENDHPTQTRGDAFGILDAALKGGGFHCGHFMVVQSAVLNAFGYVTRCLGVGPGGTPDAPGGHHGVNEVWSNDYMKWVLTDAKYDTQFEKNGIPLSALEVRDELLRNNAADVTLVNGPDRIPIDKLEEAETGPGTYRWLSWELQGDRHSNWPKFFSSALVVLDDDYFRGHTWWRAGNTNRHWAYAADYFVPVKHREWIEWTPNVLQVKASIDGSTLQGTITSSTPNLLEYQIRELPNGDWRKVDAAFTLSLSGERLEWNLRAVNRAGVAGPLYHLLVERTGVSEAAEVRRSPRPASEGGPGYSPGLSQGTGSRGESIRP